MRQGKSRAAATGCGLMREVAQLAVSQADAQGVRYEQCNRASDRQEQDKVQDDMGLQKRGGNDERAMADAVEYEASPAWTWASGRSVG